MARNLELGPEESLNHMLLVLHLGAMDIIGQRGNGLQSLWGFSGAGTRLGAWDWGQHASNKCPLERSVSKVPLAT